MCISRKGRLQGRGVILATLTYWDVVAARTSGLRSSRIAALNREASCPHALMPRIAALNREASCPHAVFQGSVSILYGKPNVAP